jgi:hypothetical protein
MPATPSSAPAPLTGIRLVDALTTGYRWNLDGSRTINFAIANGFSGEVWASPPSLARQVNQALQSFATFIDVRFNYAGYFSTPLDAAPFSEITVSVDGAGRFMPSKNTWAIGHFPSVLYNTTYVGQAGDVYLNLRSDAARLPSYEPGGEGFALLLHELGHALGLKHPHDSGGTGRPTLASLGLRYLDQDWASIMSYKDGYSWNQQAWDPASPMILDVLGLMYSYGPNQSTNAGNTTHVLRETNQYTTLWDASGFDTLNLAFASQAWTVDLDLSLDRTIGVRMGRALPTTEAAASVTPKSLNWLLGDYENIVGTNYSDSITGNGLGNVIYGIGGNDTISGGGGVDTAGYLGPKSNFSISRVSGTVFVTDKTRAEGIDRLTDVEVLRFSDAQVFVNTTSIAPAYRLYQAAFNRTPDQSGLSFWAKVMNNGMGLREVSGEFVRSAEFRSIYGANPTAEQVVDRFYQNVLGRAGEAGGFNYWVNRVQAGAALDSVLLGFSESPENIAKVAGVISNGITLDLF